MENKIKSTSQFDVQVILKLTEKEARALQAITLYGTKSFLEFFYKSLGKTYLEPNQSGLESLFETIKTELPKHLKKADDTRDIWRGDKEAVVKKQS